MITTLSLGPATPFGHIHSFLPSLAQISFLGRQQHAILVGGDNRLKRALRLISDYRLVIEEIKEAKAITSYTRWVDAVQARGGGKSGNERGADVPISSTPAANDAIYQSTATG
jgi:hypothetical protein